MGMTIAARTALAPKDPSGMERRGGGPRRSMLAVTPDVCIASVLVAPAAPGVVRDGVKVARAPAGNPDAVKLTELLNAPLIDRTLMEYCAVPPTGTV
jgi:hypothetical protein